MNESTHERTHERRDVQMSGCMSERIDEWIVVFLTLACSGGKRKILRGIHINVWVLIFLHIEQLFTQGLERGPFFTVTCPASQHDLITGRKKKQSI